MGLASTPSEWLPGLKFERNVTADVSRRSLFVRNNAPTEVGGYVVIGPDLN